MKGKNMIVCDKPIPLWMIHKEFEEPSEEMKNHLSPYYNSWSVYHDVGGERKCRIHKIRVDLGIKSKVKEYDYAKTSCGIWIPDESEDEDWLSYISTSVWDFWSFGDHRHQRLCHRTKERDSKTLRAISIHMLNTLLDRFFRGENGFDTDKIDSVFEDQMFEDHIGEIDQSEIKKAISEVSMGNLPPEILINDIWEWR